MEWVDIFLIYLAGVACNGIFMGIMLGNTYANNKPDDTPISEFLVFLLISWICVLIIIVTMITASLIKWKRGRNK